MADQKDIVMNIMRDAARLVKYYDNVPKKDAPGCREWWGGFADDLVKYAMRYDNHPLAIQMGAAIDEYLEIKGGYKNDVIRYV